MSGVQLGCEWLGLDPRELQARVAGTAKVRKQGIELVMSQEVKH